MRGRLGRRSEVTARAATIGLAIILAAAPIPAVPVERFYSRGVYPVFQRGLTWLTNLVPFALLDALIVAVAVWWTGTLARDLASHATWRSRSMRALQRTATAGAVLYLGFLATWGLNYRRVPLVEKLPFEPAAVTAAAARELALTTVAEVNALYEPAHAAASGEARVIADPLAEAFVRAQRLIGVGRPARPARPKRSLLDPYFRAAAVEGMTDPYFLETLIVSGLLPFERPFVVAHEWSHLAGFADEAEANFLGWLTCLQGPAPLRYSGWLFLYREVVASLPEREGVEAANRLDPGPRRDLAAIARRVRDQVNPTISAAGWRVYDSYLKANRVEAGAASYAEVVRLVLGVRFEPGWVPAQR